MKTNTKEAYVAPVVTALGTPAEITESGDRPDADTSKGLDGSAFKPGS